jgi:UPF0716 protein FxsA
MGRLLLLFTVVPLVELYLLLYVGRFLGVGPTVALVFLTGIVGAGLAKAEGFRVLRRWQSALAAGRMPEEGVLDGLLVLVGGVLLVTPGVLTDALGLALLVPVSRKLIARVVRRVVERRVARGDVRVMTFTYPPGQPGPSSHPGSFSRPSRPRGSGSPEVIDVEGEDVTSGHRHRFTEG